MLRNGNGTRRLTTMLMALLFGVGAAVAVATPVAADDAQDAKALVGQSRITLEGFLADETMGGPLRSLLSKAQGVLIYPQVLKGAFIVGASGGSGTFLTREGENGSWHGPAFYSIGGASFGFQAGGAALEVVLVAMTHRGVAALLSTSTKLGANVGIAVGPVGAGAEAATHNLSADILSYSRQKGVYGGVSLEGALVGPRSSLNAAYYGKSLTPTQILVKGEGSNPASKELVAVLQKAAARP